MARLPPLRGALVDPSGRVQVCVLHGDLSQLHPRSRDPGTIHARLAVKDKEMLVLRKSGHGIVVDSERETVFQRVCKWMEKRAGRSEPELAGTPAVA